MSPSVAVTGEQEQGDVAPGREELVCEDILPMKPRSNFFSQVRVLVHAYIFIMIMIFLSAFVF